MCLSFFIPEAKYLQNEMITLFHGLHSNLEWAIHSNTSGNPSLTGLQ